MFSHLLGSIATMLLFGFRFVHAVHLRLSSHKDRQHCKSRSFEAPNNRRIVCNPTTSQSQSQAHWRALANQHAITPNDASFPVAAAFRKTMRTCRWKAVSDKSNLNNTHFPLLESVKTGAGDCTWHHQTSAFPTAPSSHAWWSLQLFATRKELQRTLFRQIFIIWLTARCASTSNCTSHEACVTLSHQLIKTCSNASCNL